MATDIIGPTGGQIVPTPTTNTNSSTNSTGATLASNFTAFLQLLTTQLKNQSPLDPLDTNQFTQQLVQFAQVEQQLKANEQLTSLVALQKSSQATQALGFVGNLVAVDGSTAQLANGQAAWSFTSPSAATATVTITNASGQTIFTGTYDIPAGSQNFVWDGVDADGSTRPDGDYKLSVTAKDANGQSVAVSTQIWGTVDSVDLTQDPPLLSIGGKSYTLEQIKKVAKAAA